MEFLILKPLGYLLVIALPAKIILAMCSPRVRRVLSTKLWDDPT